MIQTQLLRDILGNNTLFEVEEIDGKLEYKLDDNGEKIRICEISEIKFNHISATKDNEYFKIKNGQRLTKNVLFTDNIGMKNPVEVYSASEFDNEVFGYIEEEDLFIQNPNQNIYHGKTILFNTGGSVGAIRFKNKNYKYTVIDNVIVYKADNDCSCEYLYYSLESIMERNSFNYSNTLRGEDLSKANLIIKMPKEKKINNKLYSSYKLQQSIAKNIEEKFQDIDKKISIIETMMKVLELKIESFLDERINNLSKKKDLISLELTSSNKYFRFTKGSRVTKSKVMSFETIENNIPIYSASKFNEEIFGFSSEGLLTKNGNVIIKNPSVLINADGSTGITRIKLNNPFALNDVVFAIEVLDQEISLNYIKRMIDNELIKHNLNYSNKLYESDLKSKEIKIKLPANEKNIIDYDAINKIDADVEKIQKSNMYLLKIQETLQLAKEKVLQQIINGEI